MSGIGVSESRAAASRQEPSALSARSVILSLLLGAPESRLSPANLLQVGEVLGIPAGTLRVALTRAVAAGDLLRDAGDYVLGPRLVARQRRQEEAIQDAEAPWDGAWEMAVVIVAGRSSGERAALRSLLTGARLAQLREGVWTRPANLRRRPAYAAEPVLACFSATPSSDPVALARSLWDLDAWTDAGVRILEAMNATSEPAPRLAVAAELVRHLASDPLLPVALLPRHWPGSQLRATYADYRAELRALGA